MATLWTDVALLPYCFRSRQWPDKEVRGGARQKVHDSACKFVRIAGKDPVALGIVP